MLCLLGGYDSVHTVDDYLTSVSSVVVRSSINTQQLSGSCCWMTILQRVAIPAPVSFPLAAAAGQTVFPSSVSPSIPLFFFPCACGKMTR
uniref:Uncharacterized protein n=1 Tax=Triticum urartu TaxID=4572 RepID=A0A8R7JV32_TRIUA